MTVLCEPQLSKRNLYPTLSSKSLDKDSKLMMNVISFCDGKSSLLEIADRLNIPIWELYNVVDTLKDKNLISEN